MDISQYFSWDDKGKLVAYNYGNLECKHQVNVLQVC